MIVDTGQTRQSQNAAASNGVWRLWARRGALAITDQALMSGSNFLLSILLARWLAPERYGVYALAFSIFFFLSSVHQALLLEPMSVLATSEYSRCRREYAGALIWFHAAFSVVIALAFGAAAWIVAAAGHRDLAWALLGLSAGAPGILFFWLARMACYVETAPQYAARGAVLYSALILGGAWALAHANRISPAAAFILMGSAGSIVALALLTKVRPALATSRVLLRQAASSHWNYGRWALGSSLVIWVPGNIFYSIIGGFVGVGGAGSFRALMNVIYPVTHSASALSLLFQPRLSGLASASGPRATLRPVARIMTAYATGAFVWLAFVALETQRVWRFLYHDGFHEASHLAVWMLAGCVFQVAAYGPAVGLRALQAPRLVFCAYSIAAATCIAAGIPATRLWGLQGAVAAYSGALFLSCCAALCLYLRRVRQARGETRVENAQVLLAEAR
jgi:O-antigen/teichoic acid export membrane protein